MSLYDALLVDRSATLEEIKSAFKRRALQVHPDKGGSKEEFHLVYQALETLGDPAARQKYDHSLATTKIGPAPHAPSPHAPYPKSRKRKREEKHAQQATSCNAKTEAKPPVPGKKSTTFAGKAPSRHTQATAKATPGKKPTTSAGRAPSKPPRAATTATPAEPQSKQTKLLMKIRDLLKRLPREVRNDVITNQLSQKQRVLLEKFMVDNAGTSSSQGHSEVKALAPAAGRIAPHPAGFESDTSTSPRETLQRTDDSSHGSCFVASCATKSTEANPRRRFAHSKEKIRNHRNPKKKARRSFDAICNEPGHSATSSTMQASAAQSLMSETSETCATTISKMAAMNEMPHEGCYALAVPKSKCGLRPGVRMTRAKPAGKMKAKEKRKARSTGCVQKQGFHSALYLAHIHFDSLEMHTGNPCDSKTALEDLMVLTAVKQKMRNRTGAGTFVECLQAALVSSAAEHGRSLKDLKLGFHVHQSAGRFIGSPLHSPSVRSLEAFGKMRGVLEPFRQYAKNLGKQSEYWRYSPVHLEDAWKRFQSAVAEAWRIAGVDSAAILQKICSRYEAQAPFRMANLQRWEQQHMARQDKNRNRPWSLRDRNPRARLECWERRQMAMEDKNKHRPNHLRERNPAARLECWERRQMSTEDKNEHRPKKMQKRNPTRLLECWERRQMALQDKNKHRPRKLRQKLPCSLSIFRQLSALRKLIARWGYMLNREAKLLNKLDKERQRVLRQRKAQHKKDQKQRRRVEVLKQKQRREEERLRRELIRKRMRSDLTMDDILGQKGVRKYPNCKN